MRQVYSETGVQGDKSTVRQVYSETGVQGDKSTVRQVYSETGVQGDKSTVRQVYSETGVQGDGHLGLTPLVDARPAVQMAARCCGCGSSRLQAQRTLPVWRNRLQVRASATDNQKHFYYNSTY